MLVDAQERFARRAAEWMLADDNLSAEDMLARIGMWPKSFQSMVTVVVKEHNAKEGGHGDG